MCVYYIARFFATLSNFVAACKKGRLAPGGKFFWSAFARAPSSLSLLSHARPLSRLFEQSHFSSPPPSQQRPPAAKRPNRATTVMFSGCCRCCCSCRRRCSCCCCGRSGSGRCCCCWRRRPFLALVELLLSLRRDGLTAQFRAQFAKVSPQSAAQESKSRVERERTKPICLHSSFAYILLQFRLCLLSPVEPSCKLDRFGLFTR